MSRQLPTFVRTPRLVLREWTEDDAQTLVDLVTANIEHLRPWMPWIADEPRSVDDRRTQITDWRAKRVAGQETTLGVFLHDGTPIGSTGLHDRGEPGHLEIGYWLAADHTGRGYATELADALTTAGLAVEGIDSIDISHDPANLASAAVPRRLGFRDVSDQTAPRAGLEQITGRWLMTAAEWPTAQHHTPSPEWIDEVRRSPADHGTLTMVLRRPDTSEREVLDVGQLDIAQGLIGDIGRSAARNRRPTAAPTPMLS